MKKSCVDCYFCARTVRIGNAEENIFSLQDYERELIRANDLSFLTRAPSIQQTLKCFNDKWYQKPSIGILKKSCELFDSAKREGAENLRERKNEVLEKKRNTQVLIRFWLLAPIIFLLGSFSSKFMDYVWDNHIENLISKKQIEPEPSTPQSTEIKKTVSQKVNTSNDLIKKEEIPVALEPGER